MRYVLRKVAYIARRPLWAAWWWWGGYKMWREDRCSRRRSFKRAFIAPWTAAHWTTTTQEERTMLAARG